MAITKSNHAVKIMAKRNITDLMITAAFEFGEVRRISGSLNYFLGKRAMKRITKFFLPKHPERWEGLVLVCDPTKQILITCFKNKSWLRKIRYNN